MIGDTIRTLRTERGLSQAEVAQGIGLSEMAIEYYEKNKWQPGSPTIAKLARFFEVTVEEMLNGYDFIHDEQGEDIFIVKRIRNNQFKIISRVKI